MSSISYQIVQGRPDSLVVRATGIYPEGPGFNPQSGHIFSKVTVVNTFYIDVFEITDVFQKVP